MTDSCWISGVRVFGKTLTTDESKKCASAQTLRTTRSLKCLVIVKIETCVSLWPLMMIVKVCADDD